MQPSRSAPSRATKRPRVPVPNRAAPKRPRQEVGPAPQVAGTAIPDPTPAVPPEPQGSPPSLSFPAVFNFKDQVDAAAWLRRVRDNADDVIALAREGARRLPHRVLA